MKLTIHIDGASRGNPGPAGAGVVVGDADGETLLEAGFFLGRMTNNMAEYHALLRGLDFAGQLRADEFEILSDSELLVRQINGQYRVKNAKLAVLHARAEAKLRGLARWTMRHIRREGNQRADRLAAAAAKRGTDVSGDDVIEGPGPIRYEPTPAAAPEPAAVRVRCAAAPDAKACAAACRAGQEFAFGSTVPPGVCLEVAAELVLAVRQVRLTGETTGVTCRKTNCGAQFQVMSAE
jgi:ribonuclease HI